ncbi:RNA polymerase-binding protein RbpA [Arcanobacterium bovis]|uniref:RNA polymerase-binding protein RbpA n=1 Tax=Arcanobacterium bovis TaxID=2529275 RepID=A0A4Q9V1F6_9ACTO|nr:RNA polymerase-binding protein RbpA [Arcanobacterium bovis]TBW22934.1 RNA polymerase-binding protein RbpA [Arcanobacterium bovis]
MVERSLRGMKIGANSLESDIGVALVDRREVTYECLDNQQRFVVTLAADAEAPAVWECRCGSEAKLIGAQVEDDDEEKTQKPVRTHWDMLLERRSKEELQELLDERLALLREGKLYKRMR